MEEGFVEGEKGCEEVGMEIKEGRGLYTGGMRRDM